MIRKSGLLIFSVFLVVILVLLYVFLGTAIRLGLKASLEEFAGAEVNIAKVSLSLNPLGLDIYDVQITDKHQPELNLLSFQLAHADLEVWPALMGYYVIDELSIKGLIYKSQRKSLGKVYLSNKDDKQPEQTTASKLSSALKLDLPSAKDLLARADLQVVAKGEELIVESEKQYKTLKELESKLPNKQTLLDLQAEIHSLTESKVSDAAELSQKTKKLDELRKQVKQESNKLKGAKGLLSKSRQQLSAAIDGVNKAKTKDWEKLQSMASIKDGGLASISQLLLGDTWGKRITQLQSFYDIAKPYIPVSSANDDNDESDPEVQLVNRILPLPQKAYPNFWIKSTKIHWLLGEGVVDIRIQDVTTEHTLINSSTQFQLNTKGLPKIEALVVQGDFSVREQMVSNINWTLDKFIMDPSSVGDSDSLSFSGGILDSKGSLKLVNNEVEQKAEMLLNNAKFTATKNKTMEKLATLLNQQPSIPLTVSASGDISSPSISVRSRLDDIIGDAVMGEAKQKVKILEEKLRNQLNQKVEEQLKSQDNWLDNIDRQDKTINELEEIIENSLKAELKNIKGQAKDKLKEQALKLRI